jgi:NADH:ubiquinone oxidoreductase subunit 6 (subunit J)
MGLFTAYTTTPLLAIVLSMALAFALSHKNPLRLLSVICLLGLVVVAIAIGLFALDAIQLRSGVPEENRVAFSVGIILTELKFLSVFTVLFFVGWGGWKTAGELPGKPKSSERAERTAQVLKAQKRDD